ncbi:uncharacterized protein PV09_06034 [Verruconis gallopava]|uniref:Uncharacterized protein n=1 Tax=Verruconis gallopava TaxID=253628 RepID=A0A0D2ATY4_9PEZI|nr:uncharacterized protein PV09_06034 [Verruconis gallopava]KIW02584.1 hypothetical protein PV09_06034 [Verruconis gallopava]
MLDEKPHKRVGFNAKRWSRKVYWALLGLLVLEFSLIVPFLTLVGISDPNTYRTKLWEDGYLNGFNSSPDTPLYAAANHVQATIPLIWSQKLTTFDLVISILATFVLITKFILLPLHIMYPVISLVVYGLETGLFSYSIYGQTSHDTIDPNHENNGLPWYIAKSCSVAAKPSNVHYCQQAKATFYITVFLLALYASIFLLSIHAIFFPPAPGNTDDDTGFMAKHFPSLGEAETTYEIPQTPMPYTPRTPWGHEMDRIPPTPGTAGGLYAPHAGYATPEAAKERERGISQYGMAPVGQAVTTNLPPVTPRTKAFQALEGGSNAPSMPSSIKAEWGKREPGNLPWSGRNSGGRNSGGRPSSYNKN